MPGLLVEDDKLTAQPRKWQNCSYITNSLVVDPFFVCCMYIQNTTLRNNQIKVKPTTITQKNNDSNKQTNNSYTRDHAPNEG